MTRPALGTLLLSSLLAFAMACNDDDAADGGSTTDATAIADSGGGGGNPDATPPLDAGEGADAAMGFEDAVVPPDTGVPPEACTGGVGFLMDCSAAGASCGTCMCATFGHVKYCTKSCTGPADCPAPSSGCGGNGVCTQ
jgi:hypothetical protein